MDAPISTKQMIVMATYLNMRKGKMVAQGSHASVQSFVEGGSTLQAQEIPQFLTEYAPEQKFLMIPLDAETEHWMSGSYKKICQGAKTEADLLQLYADAKAAGLRASLIVDSGLTEFGGVPTITCVGIGPNEDSRIDALTGKESALFKEGKLSLL
jgi:PTH2 family peptidyl-tRNA hydrolase